MTVDKAELEKVMVRIRKLLAMGTSSNEHESAAMVAKAQELLAKYDLTMESIDDLKADSRTAIRNGGHVVKTTEGKPESWKESLFEAVASTSDCFTAYVEEYEKVKTKRGERRVRHGYLIGFGHDVEMAGYELAFLIGEVERLAQEYANVMWDDIRKIEKFSGITHQQAESYYVNKTGRHPLKAKLHFIRGAAESVILNLQKWKRERDAGARAANPHALVLRKRQTIQDHMYMEQYGCTVAEYDARWKAEMAEYRAKNPPTPPKVETAEEKETREAKEARDSERAQARWEREYRREFANTDHHAVAAGRDAGEKVTVRKGIRDGDEASGAIRHG